MNEFEEMTLNDRELNEDYENLLGKDIRGLRASYFTENMKNIPSEPPIYKIVKEITTPISNIIKDYKYKLIDSKKYEITENQFDVSTFFTRFMSQALDSLVFIIYFFGSIMQFFFNFTFKINLNFIGIFYFMLKSKFKQALKFD